MTLRLKAQIQQGPNIIFSIRARERETFSQRTSVPRSRAGYRLGPLSAFEAIDADSKMVERYLLELVQEVAG